MSTRACTTCGGDFQLLPDQECEACESTGFERPEKGCKNCERLADEVERLRAWYDASQDAMGEVLTELRKQTEMLERIRREQVRGE